ncbi:MAG: YkgJ family cysteine cluster protein [Thermodesulfobacteriota bacterium]
MRPGLDIEQTRPLAQEERFRFQCHPGVVCFTECCRQLDLELTPYDVLRLAAGLGLPSSTFLDQYAVIEHAENDPFPRVFLAMVDDGRASCPFVSPQGCGVYAERPSACRTYPLGRGAAQKPDGTVHEMYILLTEPHCHGFAEATTQNVAEWVGDQELAVYHAMNDLLLSLLHHQRFQHGMRLTPPQAEQFLFALYRHDRFRAALLTGKMTPMPALSPEEKQAAAADDRALLTTGIAWLTHVLFG